MWLLKGSYRCLVPERKDMKNHGFSVSFLGLSRLFTALFSMVFLSRRVQRPPYCDESKITNLCTPHRFPLFSV